MLVLSVLEFDRVVAVGDRCCKVVEAEKEDDALRSSVPVRSLVHIRRVRVGVDIPFTTTSKTHLTNHQSIQFTQI
jgi:hypothetical protein